MRYFIGFIIVIALIILLIVLLFHHGGNGKTPATPAPLVSYANTDVLVRETIDGMTNDVQDHRQIVITVGQGSTTFQVNQGYDGQAISTQSFPMTQNAYAAFLLSLDHAGFTQGNNDSSLKDERGYCPLGQRYIFEVIQGSSDLERYWTTSCSGSTPHTFEGTTSVILNLFRNQVPNYDQLTSDVNLGNSF